MSKISFFLVASVAVLFSNIFANAKVLKSHDSNGLDVNTGLSEDYTNDEAVDYEEYSEENSNYTESPPALISEPGNFTVKEHETVYLPCNVSNSDEYASMWYKQTTLLYQDKFKVSELRHISMFPNKTLAIMNASKNDTGEYKCKISSNPALELTHHVTVLYPPRIINIKPKNSIQLDINSFLNITCQVDGEPMPSVTWSKDGNLLYKSEEKLSEHFYVIPNVKPHDAGDYQCLAHSQYGTIHDYLKVQVMYPPTVKIENSVVTTAEKYTSQLTCIVNAFPVPIVEWKKNDQTIRENYKNRFNITNRGNHYYLVISRTEENDFGKYSCAAKNPIGGSKADVILTGAPAPAEFIKIEAFPDQKNTVLQWKVESYNPISEYELQYRKAKDSEWTTVNDIEVISPLGNTYTVNYTIKDLDAGQYVTRLKAKNSHGWSNYSVAKEFTGEPVPANINEGAMVVFPSSLVFVCTYVSIAIFRYN